MSFLCQTINYHKIALYSTDLIAATKERNGLFKMILSACNSSQYENDIAEGLDPLWKFCMNMAILEFAHFSKKKPQLLSARMDLQNET